MTLDLGSGFETKRSDNTVTGSAWSLPVLSGIELWYFRKLCVIVLALVSWNKHSDSLIHSTSCLKTTLWTVQLHTETL